jgi:hypothetical protein
MNAEYRKGMMRYIRTLESSVCIIHMYFPSSFGLGQRYNLGRCATASPTGEDVVAWSVVVGIQSI